MSRHPAFAHGNTAVITGAADGIGLATAMRCAELGLNVCMADLNADALAQAATESVLPLLAGGDEALLTQTLDVADRAAIEAFREQVTSRFGSVQVLMNNAGMAAGGEAWNNYDNWRRLMEVNLWGVINGVSVFAEGMIAAGAPAAIINTGSKQGITCPPGDTPYNVSKAAVKTFTEQLQHTLRNTPDCRVTAHLLVPGFTFTGFMRPWFEEKPAAAWTPEQVVAYMFDALEKEAFYILCPDNDVTEAMDRRRMAWAMGDLIEGRPPLSRWHPDFSDAFAAFSEAADD